MVGSLSLGAASFKPAYAHVKRNEGGYANVAADRGGETYAGIARNFHPAWDGWKYIDIHKKNLATKGLKIKHNEHFSFLTSRAEHFYTTLWNRSKAMYMDQALANVYFDQYVLNPRNAVKALQQALNQAGAQLRVDGDLGKKTLAALKKANHTGLIPAFIAHRQASFRKDVARNPAQSQFMEGWMARIGAFLPSMPEGSTNRTVVLGVSGLVIGGLGYYLYHNSKKTPRP